MRSEEEEGGRIWWLALTLALAACRPLLGVPVLLGELAIWRECRWRDTPARAVAVPAFGILTALTEASLGLVRLDLLTALAMPLGLAYLTGRLSAEAPRKPSDRRRPQEEEEEETQACLPADRRHGSPDEEEEEDYTPGIGIIDAEYWDPPARRTGDVTGRPRIDGRPRRVRLP